MVLRKEMEWGGRTLSIEVGKVAKQADGAAWVQYGETVVLATVVSSRTRTENTDFFPLTVDFREMKYAAGKFPGGFFKRESRPHDKETLFARMIDRPLRPMFPKGYYYETQVLLRVISHDLENEGDILGALGASTALLMSDIPFEEAVAAVNVGRIDGEFVLNPMNSQIEKSDMLLMVAGTQDAITMVEGEAKEVDESVFLDALDFAHESIRQVLGLQNEIAREIGKETREWEPVLCPEEISAAVREDALAQVDEMVLIQEKAERKNKQKALAEELIEKYAERFPEQGNNIAGALSDLLKERMRSRVLSEKVRLDGRGLKDIRPITVEVGLLPRTHGSALFTRGQTQSLATLTLGSREDEQKIDDLEGEYWKTFILHYNFPPFSVGEVRRFLAPGRRELGHGHLAERAIKPLLPKWEEFPYTIRIVSEILESNGSSSMASVCGGTMAAMDAGVPIKRPVAGIAMGLIKEGDDFAVLSDILGEEDHLGDMDFKVTGTSDGITAFQMDIKIKGLSKEIMAVALEQAKEGREHILGKMAECMTEPRKEVAATAPRICYLTIEQDQIGMIIGPGGRTIRTLQQENGVNIDIDDDGTVIISSTSTEAMNTVKGIIEAMTEEPEIGKEYNAKVVSITDFGAFCEILPGREGLVHISELEWRRVEKVEDVLKMGDRVMVKLMNITNEGKLDLSRKALLPKPEGYVAPPKRTPGGGRSSGPRRGGSGGSGGPRRGGSGGNRRS